MIKATLCLAIVGLVFGVLALHWFGLAFLSILLSIAFLIATPWDLLLFPK